MNNLVIRGNTVRAPARVRIMDSQLRRSVVLEAAYKVARAHGIAALKWETILPLCSVRTSKSTATRAWDLGDLRRSVVEMAQEKRDSELIAEAKRLGFLK